MKTAQITCIGLSALLLFTACASEPRGRAAMVRVVSKDEVKGYKFLGTVIGSSALSGVLRETGYQNALNEVLEKAARKGATHVVLAPDSEARYWVTAQHIRAEAYRAP